MDKTVYLRQYKAELVSLRILSKHSSIANIFLRLLSSFETNMTFCKTALLAAILAVTPSVYSYWIFGGTPPVVTTRLDSIISPGVVSTHVHAVRYLFTLF